MKKKKAAIIILSICVLIGITVAGILFYQQYQKNNIYKNITIEFKPSNIIEYGDNKILSKDLVKSSNGTITKYPDIDSTHIGTQRLIYEVNESGIKKEVIHEIIIKDSKTPIIKLKKKTIELNIGEKYKLNDNILEVMDPVDGTIPYAEKDSMNAYWIVSEVDFDTPGDYIVAVYAKDINGNDSKEEFTIIVKEFRKEPEETGNTTSDPNKSNRDEPYYVNGILLVNKLHGLPYEYGSGVDATAYAALKQLQNGANTNGYDMPLLSGYRSFDYQASLYNNYVAMDGQAAADRYSARPGYSEHQTGLAFDIGELNNNYGTTPAGQWLAKHAHEYGFIIRYPQGKESVTGYMYEPWHVRYLGIDLASNIYASGLTLEEYLGEY